MRIQRKLLLKLGQLLRIIFGFWLSISVLFFGTMLIQQRRHGQAFIAMLAGPEDALVCSQGGLRCDELVGQRRVFCLGECMAEADLKPPGG